MSQTVPAEVFAPGELLHEELEARGWTQQDLAEIMGCSHRLINEIVNAKRSITAETAKGLAAALDTSSQLWLNLESAYRLHLTDSDDSDVRRRARVHELAPVAELRRRGWIRDSRKVTELEQDLCEFFSITTIEEEPELWQHAARKSGGYESVTPAQRAWLFRVAELASAVKTHSFTEEALAGAIEELRALHRSEKGVEEVACVLASAGVRFLIVEHLKSTKIDGACLWLGHSTPIVALTLRYDRIDWFWHTLMHELGHVKNSDGRYKPLMPDTNLVGRDSIDRQEKPLIERRADRFASEQLIPRTKIASFLRRTEHFLSKDRIRVFAESVGVHPGIVVGRLQHMERVPYSHYREMLVRVRDRVVKSTMTDGWGHSPK